MADSFFGELPDEPGLELEPAGTLEHETPHDQQHDDEHEGEEDYSHLYSMSEPRADTPSPTMTKDDDALQVKGLPPQLNEEQARQLLSHFGALAYFELQRAADSSTALLRYQDASVTKPACASLNGIPLGDATLSASIVTLDAPAPTQADLADASVPDLLAKLQSQLGAPAAAPPPMAVAHPLQPPRPAAVPMSVSEIEARMRRSAVSQPMPPPPPPPPPQQQQQQQQQVPVSPLAQLLPAQAAPHAAPNVMQGLPPQVRVAMAQQVAAYPAAQQPAVVQQLLEQHRRVQQLYQQASAQSVQLHQGRRVNLEGKRVGKRMSGAELLVILRHQSMQVPQEDPVVDDFYHHFWMMKGGQSQAVGRASVPVAKIRTTLEQRRSAESNTPDKPKKRGVDTSLGQAVVVSRSPAAKLGAPKPLIVMPTSPAPGDDAEGEAAASLMSDGRWKLRLAVESARAKLIELRVLASSAAVRTPEGLGLRAALLVELWRAVSPPSADGLVDPTILLSAKGQKLLAELLPLWSAAEAGAILRSIVREMPRLASLPPPAEAVRAWVAAVASAPARLASPLEANALLSSVCDFSDEILGSALQLGEVRALLLGLMSLPAVEAPTLQRLYETIAPHAATMPLVWKLFHAASGAQGDRLSQLRTAVERANLTMSDECVAELAQLEASG